MPITYTATLGLSLIPVGTDGATANNERNADMTRIDALFGTNVLTPGSVLFASGTGKVTQDNANLFWDDAFNRLGIGTVVPVTPLHVLASTTQLRLSTISGIAGDADFRISSNLLDIDVHPTGSPANAVIRLFRSTFTTDQVYLQVFNGNSGAPVVNAQIGGSLAPTYFAANNGSVGIGTSSIDASAILEVMSTTKGLLLPRLTTTQRDAVSSPTAGLLIYNSTLNAFQGRTNSTWITL